MPQYHQVQQGDYLAKIATQYGFTDYHSIWEHPRNAPLNTRRQNPNVLYPGDILYIPDMQEKQESRGTSQRHSFQVAGPTVRLRVALKDPTGEPLRNLSYTLLLDSDLVRGKTDGAGMI